MRLVSFLFVIVIVTSFANRPVVYEQVKVNKIVYSAVLDLPFNEENLMIVIKRFGIRFSDIVIAQAKLETGNFRSKSFTKHNNLFGMKVAKSRLTVATGESLGHARYDHWTYSVMDYALFQSTFARKIRTRKGYMRYLSRNYAEDKSYVQKIGKLIN